MGINQLEKSLAGRGPILLTLPVFNKLMQIEDGLLRVLDFIEDLESGGDSGTTSLFFDKGEIIISAEGPLVFFSIDFLGSNEIKAELNGHSLEIIGYNLPEAYVSHAIGRPLKDLIELPRAMSDLSDYRMMKLENRKTSLLIELNIGRLKKDPLTTRMIIHQVKDQKESRIGKAA